MSKYFLSFTSTFESLLTGKLTINDLATGNLVFGCKREHVLLPYDLIPIEVTAMNKVKPKQAGSEKSATASRGKIDNDVLRVWDAFASQMRKASTEGRLIFLHDIGHPSYHHLCRDILHRGDEVFWHGAWVTSDKPVGAPTTQHNTPAGLAST